MMKLWIDDIRTPPDNTWTWAKSYSAAVDFLRYGTVDEVSFDHDLGEDSKSGYHVVCWMENHSTWPTLAGVHTANPVGRSNIIRALVANGYDCDFSKGIWRR
jgi:hypothetical protein